jgi:hypothetical protein
VKRRFGLAAYGVAGRDPKAAGAGWRLADQAWLDPPSPKKGKMVRAFWAENTNCENGPKPKKGKAVRLVAFGFCSG